MSRGSGCTCWHGSIRRGRIRHWRWDYAIVVLLAELPPGRYAVAVEVRLQQRVVFGCAEVPEVVLAGLIVVIQIGVVKVLVPIYVNARVGVGVFKRWVL